MRIGVNLGPTANWPSMLAAARTADALGFETLGFLDHCHAPGWIGRICVAGRFMARWLWRLFLFC
jgi:alkanesulfonate monooxygenase SsuD/methylene tetrahydromethanopterin reductase-like flavin-dependent oxidoreductase (luciferase family)